MGVADDLCDALFCWIEKQEKCADHLMALANELENMREVMTAGRMVGNTATVLGSAALVGTGIATLLTGGLAAPLLALTAGITTGVGTATNLTLSLVETWKSSQTMKDAEKTTEQIKQIQNNIERLQQELQEECESQGLEASSSDDVQCEITVRILRAVAKRSGKDLPLSRLRPLFRSDGMYTPYRHFLGFFSGFNPDTEFFCTVDSFLLFLGYSAAFLKTVATKAVATKAISLVAVTATKEMAPKAMEKGADQVSRGILGLVFTIPDLIDNCEELIKNKHQTEASRHLKTKAKELREAVKNLKKQLNELQEMLNQIPEVECQVDYLREVGPPPNAKRRKNISIVCALFVLVCAVKICAGLVC